MTTTCIEVATDPAYPVYIGPAALDALVPNRAQGVALLADERVWDLYGDLVPTLADLPRLLVPGGEGAKTIARLEEALDFCTQADLSRASTLVTFGGGTIGDLGGLCASLFKRGMAVVHAPTTLLAQVDASVGGKTAINLRGGKNLAGTFHQPSAVYCDTRTLASLPAEESASGLGEVVKTALLGGEDSLARLEERAGDLLAGDPEALATTVAEMVAIKAQIVASDPTERGPRRALNLGHTFAHAIEHAAGYGRVPHGVAVAAGLGLALRASRESGLLGDPALPGRVDALLHLLGLPGGLRDLRERQGLALEPRALRAGLAHDKKGAVARPEFVLLRAVGEPQLGLTLDAALLDSLLAE